jgi:hypothetical protein
VDFLYPWPCHLFPIGKGVARLEGEHIGEGIGQVWLTHRTYEFILNGLENSKLDFFLGFNEIFALERCMGMMEHQEKSTR